MNQYCIIVIGSILIGLSAAAGLSGAMMLLFFVSLLYGLVSCRNVLVIMVKRLRDVNASPAWAFVPVGLVILALPMLTVGMVALMGSAGALLYAFAGMGFIGVACLCPVILFFMPTSPNARAEPLSLFGGGGGVPQGATLSGS